MGEGVNVVVFKFGWVGEGVVLHVSTCKSNTLSKIQVISMRTPDSQSVLSVEWAFCPPNSPIFFVQLFTKDNCKSTLK